MSHRSRSDGRIGFSRRSFCQASGAAAAMGAFSIARADSPSPLAKLPIDNGKSDSEIVRNAWQRGLAVLKPTPAQLQRGLELHSRVLACDTFAFLPGGWTQEVADLWNELKDGSVGARELSWRADAARAVAPSRDPKAAAEFVAGVRATGLKCIVTTVAEGKSREEDVKRMAFSRQMCRVFRQTLVQVGSRAEVREAAAQGRVGVIWSVNGPPIVGKLADPDEELSWIDTWYQLGVRLMHLTYNRRNFIGDGCAEPANGGLSELGRALIKKMNEVGIIVDTPHSGIRTTLDAAKASAKPMMASHTGARAVFNHMRCKTDEELKAIAATGGLVGVYVLPNMLGPDANLLTMLNHVDYIARLVGTDHVAIGTDTTYQAPWPKELHGYPKARYSSQWWGNWNKTNHPLVSSDEASAGSLAWTNWPIYTVGLVTRGYSDADVEKILGQNFLRVLDANRPAKEIQL